MRPPLAEIPEHLLEYITEQDPSLYTPIDHAVWRYVMRVSKAFFAVHGHPLYVHGLDETGISTDRVPLISEMDEALKKIGWRAVAINGFIPPSVFLEFQSLRILAIACDIRKLENIGYTPSPDIIHEAAGHVPIVADPGYRAYLEAYGEVARNAIITKADLELYGAVFDLSEIKENPKSTPEQIAKAQQRFEELASRESKPSEAALLTRMAWWTTEYGLIEGTDKPLIYGAGLLSSISESYHCLDPSVKKIPFSLSACIGTSYDITRPQPQLFVAKDFQELTRALNEFADSMAFRRGGAYGLRLGVEAENTVTAVLDSGLQLSGILHSPLFTTEGTEAGFTLSGAKQLSSGGVEISESETGLLPEEIAVFLFPEAIRTAPAGEIARALEGAGVLAQSGHILRGHVVRVLSHGPTGLVLVVKNLEVRDSQGRMIAESGGETRLVPIASRIVSVFGGAADRKSFVMKTRGSAGTKVKSHKTNLTAENAALNELYRKVRECRDQNGNSAEPLLKILTELDARHPEDWLLRLELLELISRLDPMSPAVASTRQTLENLKSTNKDFKEMIERGLQA